jgi:hypothetical protein
VKTKAINVTLYGHGPEIQESGQFNLFHSKLDAVAWLGLDVTIVQAACRKLTTDKKARLQEGKVLDVPPEVPTSFQTPGKRRKGTV